jgi:lipoprotein-anchoring transpeptidase ErfK/SrfK
MAGDDPPPFVPHRSLPSRYTDDGLPFHYAFVGPNGATGFRDLARAEEDVPEADLDPGFAVALVEERDAYGQRWGKTKHGVWIALSSLNVVRPPTLHGDVVVGGNLDLAWVLAERAPTYADPKGQQSTGVRMRFELVHRHEEAKGPGGVLVRVSADGERPEWMRAKDLAKPTMAAPPDEVGGKDATERWIDVELRSETVVAYEGARPVYAALASTGRGQQGTETATPLGVHRIWVKLETSTMGNLGDEDADSHYSIEDVPYVQFFAKGVALHGAFWHHSFGLAHSHGCVNLAPVDARWLFDFTAPEMPAGWIAALPAGDAVPGTVVRVR